ncbi:MAG: GspH/FimT family pseudopilin [Candidatus Methylopumilus sp.]|jgi:type IV fimbrial biogenesis protein FimT
MLSCHTTARRAHSARGFSLIELMITVSLVGILAAVAFPNFRQWMQDTKTRTVAESLQNGIRLAQTEAVKRGRNITFLLTNDAPALGVTASTTGKNWVVESMTLANATTPEVFIQGATLTDVATVVTTASSASIRFNSMGRLVSPANSVTYSITNAGGSRRLNVTVSIAGKIRMCDPDKTLSTSNPDGC